MLSLNDCFVFRKIFNVHLLVPIKRNSISSDVLFLNETAALIIDECSNADTAHDLALSVSEKFVDVEKDDVVPELESYINELISSGILLRR